MKKYTVKGMTCAACVANVERAVRKVNGVTDVNVNLLSGAMQVEGDANAKEVTDAVEKAGYSASEADKPTAPRQTEEAENADKNDERNVKHRLIWSCVILAALMYISMGHMINAPLPSFLHGQGNQLTNAFTQFLLALSIALINRVFFVRGFKALFHLSPNMDSLIALGSSAAYIYGAAAIYAIGYGYGHDIPQLVEKYSSQLYFESGAMILTLITIGKYLESKSKGRTGDALRKLMDLAPKFATVERDGTQTRVPLSDVRVGDIAVVRQGEGIPVDGKVVTGESFVDQSAMTGESIPVEVVKGSYVRAGTMNQNGVLRVEAEKVANDTTLSQIVRLVEEASGSKAPIARLADKIAAVFVPTVMAIASATLIIWLILGYDVSFALNRFISVLVISCPCALGLATPVAIMVGTGRGANMGILFKNARALERAHSIKSVVFDKTGTLTMGKPKVTAVKETSNELASVALSLEIQSSHPLGDAIVVYAREKGVNPLTCDSFVSVPGRGVKAVVNGKVSLGGNAQMMEEAGVDLSGISSWAREQATLGRTVMYFSRDKASLGAFAVADTPKPDSAKAVSELEKMGIEVIMLTGDNDKTARAIADELGISRVIADVLPTEKERHIASAQSEYGAVAMVGDGINDAPALARADLGISVASGSDIAIDSADVVLMKSSALDVANAVRLSRAVITNIKENLFWAFFYNAALIPLAAGAFYNWLGWSLNPMIGAAAMSLSSLCVVSNALRLLRFKEIGQSNIIKEDGNMEKTVHIEGMMCEHCVSHVSKALNALPGVKATVVLKDNLAKVTGAIGDDSIRKAVEDAGYKVVGID